MRVQRVLVAWFATFAIPAFAHAGVIVVDAAGGGSFTQIQPAVNAALDGDTILIKPGNYSGFAINAKSLTVVGDVGTLPNLTSRARVENLALGQVVTLARLKGQGTGTTSSFATALEVDGCLGAVRIVSCEFTGRSGAESPVASPGAGASATDSHNVAFTGCTLRGGNGRPESACVQPIFGSTPGAFGMHVLGGSVAGYECLIDGGHGGNGGDRTGPGGEAVYVDTASGSSTPAFFFASRSNIHGGVGGSTDCAEFGCARSGGDGIHLRNEFESTPDPLGWFFDLMVGGGAPGTWTNGSNFRCDPPAPGNAYSGIPGFTFSVASLGFSIPAVAREGDFVTVTFTGVPGAQVFLNDELTTTFQSVASWRGVLLSPFPDSLIGPARSRRWGTIPASGVLTANYRVPTLMPGEEAQTRFLQAYRMGPNGITLGTFRTLTVLDSAF